MISVAIILASIIASGHHLVIANSPIVPDDFEYDIPGDIQPVQPDGSPIDMPTATPMCTAKTLGGSRASNLGLAVDCDTLLAIKSVLRMSGRIDYDTPLLWDHSYALNWSARTPLTHWRAVTLGGTPQRVIGVDFSDTRESVKVYNARTRRWADGQPFTREWTLRGVIPTQLGSLTALETLDLGGSELTGVIPTQLGALTRLRTLDLSNNKLTGELPTGLDDLDLLGRARLAGNGFTGCAPAELWRITSHDLDALGLPNCKPPLTYGAPSRTGIVDAPGEHAFFTNRDPALTYEALRNDVLRVVIHKQDAGGVPRDAIYDDVDAGDDFEWREADDCWVRYLVERVLPDPTDVPLKVLAVRRYGYAYTGCSGMVSLTGERTLTWIPPNIRGVEVTVPVRHGPWLLHPYYQESMLEEQTRHVDPSPGAANDAWIGTDDPSEARRIMPRWREPVVPHTWYFAGASTGGPTDPIDGYSAGYHNERGYPALDIYVYYSVIRPRYIPAIFGTLVDETRVINGQAMLLRYSPVGPDHHEFATTIVYMYDHFSEVVYRVSGIDTRLTGDNIDEVIDIARSLLPANQSGE